MSRVGYTTGVFDMFHVGHLNILRKAKIDCDFLIVGITTDELCLEAKGKQPIIPFSERMMIVESIKFVDMVVPQTTLDKIEAWNNLKFNVMYVGDDWKGTKTWDDLERTFSQKGVEIKYFEYTDHTSSSKLRTVLDLF